MSRFIFEGIIDEHEFKTIVGDLIERAKTFCGQFKGILQTDGYVAYDKVGGVGMVHACCWAHARRKVFDALKLNPDDRLATQLASRIDELFAIDAEAREAGMDDAARHLLRQDRAHPLLGVIKQEMETAQAVVLPASALGKAISYTLTLWDKLTLFLGYPEIELSNSITFRELRPYRTAVVEFPIQPDRAFQRFGFGQRIRL